RQSNRLRPIGRAPIRADRPLQLHRRLLACLQGRTAVREGEREYDTAVRTEQGRAAAEWHLRGCAAGAQACLSIVLQLGLESFPSPRTRPGRTAALSRGRGILELLGSQRPWTGDLIIMATQPEIRVGVIGAGALGYHHVRILRDVPGARLVGFFESRPERASAVAQELGVRSFDRLDSLLDAVDAATVVVPTPVHYEVAKAALARGKHLLIEKPIASTLGEADELLALAKRTGALIQTGHVERFNRAIRAALPHVEKA